MAVYSTLQRVHILLSLYLGAYPYVMPMPKYRLVECEEELIVLSVPCMKCTHVQGATFLSVSLFK